MSKQLSAKLRSEWVEFFSVLWKESERDMKGVHRHWYDETWTKEEALAHEFAWKVTEPDTKHIEHLGEKAIGQLFNVLDDMKNSQVVAFDAEQAQVFMGLDMSPVGPEHYQLPFNHVFLWFPGGVSYPWLGTGELNYIEAILVSRHEVLGQIFERLFVFERKHGDEEIMERARQRWGDEPWPANTWCEIYTEEEVVRSFDASVRPRDYIDSSEYLEDAAVGYTIGSIRKLVNACIGYINCENVYLHRESVPDKVNRKRERRGKARLEPYYVCRIRGVQYDSQGRPTGEGTAHGYRYDVRGHFRRLESGKVTWVRPHQRGLKHELYIPKTYVVEQGAKQLEVQVK